MWDLSWDLVEEILYWIPATSLKRLRCVCKRWNALFKEPRFSQKHFHKAPKQSHVLILKEYKIFSMSVDLNVLPPSIEYKGALDLNGSHSNSEQVFIAEVYHCDGLLLCITNDNRPVVWNPCLGETRWIQHKNGYHRSCKFALGYENNQSCRSYKALMFWECDRTNNPDVGFEIYEFSSNTWRVFKASNIIRIIYSGVTLKGNTYWIAVDKYDSEGNYLLKVKDYLLSFDFTRERFRRLCFPPSLIRGHCMALSAVREEQLSVLVYKGIGSKDEIIEMWVTKKIDTEAELSWSKSFAVDLHSSRAGCVLFTSLLIDEEKKVALCCNSSYATGKDNVVYTIGEDDEYYTEIPYIEEPNVGSWWPCIFSYVPSLVQIQSK